MSARLKSNNKDRGGRRYQPFFRKLKTKEGPTEYEKFKTTVWRFATEINDRVNLTLSHDSSQADVDRTYDTINDLLTGAMQRVMQDSNYPDGLVQIALDIPDSDFSFNYSPVGPEAVTLAHMMKGGGTADVVDQISRKIQSGKDVFLNANTELTVYLYQNPKGGMRVREAIKGNFIKKSMCVVRIVTPPNDYSCAARAMCAGKAKLTLSDKEWNSYRTNMKKNLSANAREAKSLLQKIRRDEHHPAGFQDINAMARELDVCVCITEITDRTKPEQTYRWPMDNRARNPTVHLLLNDKHFDLITNVKGFYRAFSRNDKTSVCERCHHTFDERGRESHRCDLQEVKRRKTTNFKIRRNAKDLEQVEEYIEVLTPQAKTTRKILFYDVETMVVGRDKSTNEEEPLSQSPDIGDHGLDPDWIYTPAEWIPRQYDMDDYKFKQVIYLIVVQDEQGQEWKFKSTQDASALAQFMLFLQRPENAKALLIAHFAGGFDAHFLIRETLCGEYFCFGKDNAPLLRGQKIVTAKIINEIKLLDSYNFIAAPLASFPKIFDLDGDLAKGYFPHCFARMENLDYEGPIPDKNYYEPDQMKPAGRSKFLVWHEEQVNNEVEFNFMKECESYCSMDVTLLRQGMMKLRGIFLDMKDGQGRDISIDIFNSTTIPGVCFKIFRTYFLEENTICKIHPPPKDQFSAKSIYWLEYQRKKDNVHIKHALNGGEERIRMENRINPVDGYCAETNTIYSFAGCFWHGCSRCYDSHTKHPLKTYSFPDSQSGEMVTKNVKMHEVLMQFEEQNNWLRRRGYTVVVMWECDWDRLVKLDKIECNRDDLQVREPLNPRDSYKGGRTEALMTYYKVSGNEKLHYVDVTSMYPAVMAQNAYPIGPPTILKRGRDLMIPIDQLFGAAKVRIRSPEQMHLPFLPVRSDSGKIKFGLGIFTGTYTSIELQVAVQLGYVIERVYEQWHYPRRSEDLYKGYIDTFFEMKKQAKEEGNVGLATVAKLCLNSMYGKFGQSQTNNKETRIINCFEDLSNLLFGDFTEVAVTLINDQVGYATITKAQTIIEDPNTNVLLASFITSYARTKLYMEGYHKLQEKMLYADTDSLIYVSPTGDHLIPIDQTGALGLWTSELEDEEDYFEEFVSSGPKTYALISKSGKGNMVKSKGFSLHYRNSQLFNFEKLKEQVFAKACNIDLEKMVLHQDEMIMRRHMFEIIVEINRGKKINLVFDKRKMNFPTFQEGVVQCITTSPVQVM